jgi:hypothetical protein
MFAVREIDRLESRALAALRFVDAASGLIVETPLGIVAPTGTRVLRNRSGLYVLHAHLPLAAHEDAFLEPPPAPALGSLALRVEVHDASGLYLARAATIQLPRDAQPANAATGGSLFRAIPVELYRAPSGPVGSNWAALRITLRELSSGDALGGALLRVASGGRTLARGQSDWRGEALVPVVGVPVTTWSDGEDAVLVSEIDATLEVYFDAASGGTRVPAAQLNAAAPPVLMPNDPAALESNPAATRLDTAIRLASGRPRVLSLQLDLPA